MNGSMRSSKKKRPGIQAFWNFSFSGPRTGSLVLSNIVTLSVDGFSHREDAVRMSYSAVKTFPVLPVNSLITLFNTPSTSTST